MVSRSRRGGVPVLSRPTSKPNSLMQSDRCSAEASPARPAGKWVSPIWINPLRKVPDVRITALALIRSPDPVMTPLTRPLWISSLSTVPRHVAKPDCARSVACMASRFRRFWNSSSTSDVAVRSRLARTLASPPSMSIFTISAEGSVVGSTTSTSRP